MVTCRMKEIFFNELSDPGWFLGQTMVSTVPGGIFLLNRMCVFHDGHALNVPDYFMTIEQIPYSILWSRHHDEFTQYPGTTGRKDNLALHGLRIYHDGGKTPERMSELP